MRSDDGSVDLVGYQIRFTPLVPFVFGRSPRGPKAPADSLLVAHMASGGVRNVMIGPGSSVSSTEFQRVRLGGDQDGIWSLKLGDNGTTVLLGDEMNDVSDVGKLAANPSAESTWQIETESYAVAWPDGYVVKSGARWPFEFHGIDEGADDLILLRGPLHGAKETPSPPQLVAPGQEVVESNLSTPTPWVEVRYTAQGRAWRQRHFYAVLCPETVVLVTTQGPEARANKLATDGERIASSIKPVSPRR